MKQQRIVNFYRRFCYEPRFDIAVCISLKKKTRQKIRDYFLLSDDLETVMAARFDLKICRNFNGFAVSVSRLLRKNNFAKSVPIYCGISHLRLASIGDNAGRPNIYNPGHVIIGKRFTMTRVLLRY